MDFITKVSLWAVRLLCLWPSVKECIDQDIWTIRHRQTKNKSAIRQPHAWTYISSIKAYHCTMCCRISKKALRINCKHTLYAQQRIIETAHPTHSLHILKGPGIISLVFCSKCASYSTMAINNLADTCLNKVQEFGPRTRLNRMEVLKHPKDNITYSTNTKSLR